MAREIFNPNLALFVNVPEGGTTFQPNPNSVVQSDTGVSHLEFFKFVGRLVGKALYDGQLMDAYFTRSFYKHMLGQPLTYEVSQRGGASLAWGGGLWFRWQAVPGRALHKEARRACCRCFWTCC